MKIDILSSDTNLAPIAEPRLDKLTAEMLLAFSEWSQGFLPIDQALHQIITGFGAVSGTLCRVKVNSGNSRIIATCGAASVRDISGLNSSLTYPIIGDEIARLKSGATDRHVAV